MNEIAAQAASIIHPLPRTLGERAARFLRSPLWVKRILISRRVGLRPRDLPTPIELDFGAWWLPAGSALDRALTWGFELAEIRFVSRYLRPGATVLDIGAHHGLYTLLASRIVGPSGRVIAFEPSPRESNHLKEHIRLNRCNNVQVETLALGDTAGEAELFLADGEDDWCNSLRQPAGTQTSLRIQVQTATLDDYLERSKILVVDFVKLDVEGAEWSVLKGASRILRKKPRPTFLVEVQDIRTAPWGYAAREIVELLNSSGYRWYAIQSDGTLGDPLGTAENYDGNFAAIPLEKIEAAAAEFRGQQTC